MSGIDKIALENAFLNGGTGRVNKGDTLGKDEFLKLMIAQMQNQDPLEPNKDTDFIAQMAQFSSLEQMLNMNKTMTLSSAIGLIGSSVEWTDDRGNVNIGIIHSAMVNTRGVVQVIVGDKAVDFDKIKVVTNDGTSIGTATALIGKQVAWIEEDGKNADGSIKYKTVNGIVESVVVVNGYPLLMVGKDAKGNDVFVDLNSIIGIREAPPVVSTPPGNSNGEEKS
jgi:flagellar basal-body rod modification protein FlgD